MAYVPGLTTAYNDAMSHLNVSRLVVDNLQPGLSQMGSVWLPLSHFLFLPFIWNDWMWQTGIAGSIVSMVAFVLSAIGIYRIVSELTTHRWASVAGAAAFALNLNALYLQATPLTEPVYLVFFIFSCLYLVKYFKTGRMQYLLPASFFTAGQILVRYDGWFVAGIMGMLLLYHELYIKRTPLGKTVGNLVLYGFPVLFAALFWLGWNLILFQDPLYSFTGPYSARAQQEVIASQGGLITKGDPIKAAAVFILDMKANIGWAVLLLGTIGWILYVAQGHALYRRLRVLVLAALASIVGFNVLALYLGFSIINLPELNWNPSNDPAGTLFNVRYGILALPLTAVGVGLLATRHRIFPALLLLCVVAQAYAMSHSGIITIDDGTKGSSAFVNQDVARHLKERVQPNDTVVMSTSSFNAVAYQSGLPLKQFIHEGVSRRWKDAIASPDRHAEWVVMANGKVGDPVYGSLVVNESSAFLKYYQLSFAGAHANVYERKRPEQIFSVVENGAIVVDHAQRNTVGVNSYDLAYRTTAEIDETFRRLKAAHINTVRFWAFGDGLPQGFQPSAGEINEQRMATMDYILADARQYGIRVIPVLANNWEDYGGAKQYLRWTGSQSAPIEAFYTDAAAQQLFRNYINHMVTRTNSITGVTYANDPTILAWELVNEPRGAAQDVANWSLQVGDFVKSLDPNHLITVGMDKYMADTGLGTVCAAKPVDFCSVHVYLENGGRPYYPDQGALRLALQSYASQAAAAKKPLEIGEIGVSKATAPFGKEPFEVLRETLKDANTAGAKGWLIWNWSLLPDSNYGFSPEGSEGAFTAKDLNGLAALKH